MTDITPDLGSELVPIQPETGLDDTLGGYLSLHNRSPAFEGSDGHPYTVSLETEIPPDERTMFSGYLVFPCWAETGVGIVGHLETPLLLEAVDQELVNEKLGALTLLEVKSLLEEAILRHDKEND